MADKNKQRARQDYQRGRLAVDVYKPKGERGVDGWELMAYGDDVTTGLKAQVYKSKNGGEIVIAFAGTDVSTRKEFLSDMVANSGFVKGHLTDQLEAGLEFCAKVINDEVNYITDNNAREIEGVLENISLAGHSLGGGIAQLAGYVFGIAGTTMDAPGVKRICKDDSFKNCVSDLRGRYAHLVQAKLGEKKKADFRCFTEFGSAINLVGGKHHGKKIRMNNVKGFFSMLASIAVVAIFGPVTIAYPSAIVMAGNNFFFKQHDKGVMLEALQQRYKSL